MLVAPPAALRSLRVAVVLALLSLAPSEARAQSPADKAAAESLFEDARALSQLGKYAEACPKFAESQRLDPGVGVLLYLGDCYEKTGRLASAWAAFKEAGPAARAQGQADREKTANDRAAMLAPKLAKLSIVVPPASVVEGLEVRRDSTVVGAPLFGTAVPVDAGSYTITATAPGREPWSATISTKDGTVAVVNVPALAPGRGGATAPGSKARGEFELGGQHIAGFVLGGVGVAGLIAGATLGGLTISDWSDAESHCDEGEPRRCDATGVELADSATTKGTASTIAFAIGGAAAATGIILLATADWSAPTTEHAIAFPWFTPDAAGVAVIGTF